jgi:cell volume regulation protein A
VPIVLALFPLMAGVAGAAEIFNIAFIVVLTSLVVQGSTIGLAARRLGMVLPPPRDEQGVRAMFGDFQIDPGAPIGEVCAFYDLPAPDHPAQTVAAWMRAALGRAPVVSDVVHLGHAVFVVRSLQGGAIAGVGLGLGLAPEPGDESRAGLPSG